MKTIGWAIASCILAAAVPLAIAAPAGARQQEQTNNQPDASRIALNETLQRPVAVERDGAVTTVPLILFRGKYALDAALNGIERRFIFDTGSPTMISRELADALDLTIIGSNTGRDANGRAVTTQIAIVDRLEIGGATFRSVPVLIADFGVADPNGCFFDGGVIGSEIFPGSVWHIDADREALQIAATAGDLELPNSDQPEDAVIEAQLYDYGYPHAPILDYGFGDFSDKALFDTGNSDTIVLFDRIIPEAIREGAIVDGTVNEGRGSHGVSAGGAGAITDLIRFDIQGVRIGETALERQRGTTRSAPPSLIGLGLLASHNVTLDYTAGREPKIVFRPRADRDERVNRPPYSLMVVADAITVVQRFEGAGELLLGDHIIAIDGRSPSINDGSPCAIVNWLADAQSRGRAQTLTVMRAGERVEIDVSGS
ncbi:MAG: retropepsin-like aspartic protease [Erythrobacter sp.]